jgi:ElaB/YqjD/DUF883 family membrane-anchored ribosome-binding protein
MEEQREGQSTTGAGSASIGGSIGGSTGSAGTSGINDNTGLGARTGFGGTGDGDDAGTRAGSYDRKFINEEHGVKERVGETVHSSKNRLADQMARVGDRIEERARNLEQSGGVQGKAGHVALRASETLDRGADYIRNHEVDEMRDDLENAIRQRPLLSIGIAAGAGFLLARLFRD